LASPAAPEFNLAEPGPGIYTYIHAEPVRTLLLELTLGGLLLLQLPRKRSRKRTRPS